jgi:NTP pyrophosphatase (non-canonical NTP hydrolase)
MPNFNQLSESQTERLAILTEEMGESLQIIGKITRHGLLSKDPTKIDSPTNQQLLEKELSDVIYGINLLINSKDLDLDEIIRHCEEKGVNLQKYLHHN